MVVEKIKVDDPKIIDFQAWDERIRLLYPQVTGDLDEDGLKLRHKYYTALAFHYGLPMKRPYEEKVDEAYQNREAFLSDKVFVNALKLHATFFREMEEYYHGLLGVKDSVKVPIRTLGEDLSSASYQLSSNSREKVFSYFVSLKEDAEAQLEVLKEQGDVNSDTIVLLKDRQMALASFVQESGGCIPLVSESSQDVMQNLMAICEWIIENGDNIDPDQYNVLWLRLGREGDQIPGQGTSEHIVQPGESGGVEFFMKLKERVDSFKEVPKGQGPFEDMLCPLNYVLDRLDKYGISLSIKAETAFDQVKKICDTLSQLEGDTQAVECALKESEVALTEAYKMIVTYVESSVVRHGEVEFTSVVSEIGR